MSLEDAQILGDRAESFLRNARYLQENGEYDLAAFNVGQHCQLILKYKLLLDTGAYPRIHSVVRLVRELADASPELKILIEDDSNTLFLTRIEDFYIVARYLPRRFELREVEATLKFITEVFKPLVDRV